MKELSVIILVAVLGLAGHFLYRSWTDVHARCPTCDQQMASDMNGWLCTNGGCRACAFTK